MTLWKINCAENHHPGLWQRWFRHQCVAVGWHSKWGYSLSGPTDNRGWKVARNALSKMKIGDYIVVSLSGHRIGRLGQITSKSIEDKDWDPLVPSTREDPEGEMGRRVLVRWDMTVGPEDRDMVVLLPEGARLTQGELRPTISEIRSISMEKIKSAMNDQSNWVGLLSHFDYESALSSYIAAYPHHLEDGLTQHPNERIRERVFKDKSRLDVILLDRDEKAVIVECKQGQPTVENIKQLQNYIRHLKKETDKEARGILVHGGSRRLHRDVKEAAQKAPAIEIVQHALKVEFAEST